MQNRYWVYIMTDAKHSTLYTGVTNNLTRRVYEHKNKINDGFTSKYYVTYLVWYEEYGEIEYAIRREKQIKGGSRAKKKLLVNSFNPQWRDLYESIISV